MSQTSFAVFTCDILPTAAPSARAAIQGVVQAELSKPHRRVRQPLGNQWLVRFDDGGFNAFVLVMSTLRARHPEAFRYLVVGWNDMGSVALYPLGGAAPTTLSLITAMAAVASGADELAAPLLLASGPLTADAFPLQWTEEASEAEDLLGAPTSRTKRLAPTTPRRKVGRPRSAPVAASVGVAEVAVREPAPVAAAPVAEPTVSAAPAGEETTGRARKNARRKAGAGKARGKQAPKRVGAKARGKSAAKKAPRAELAAKATKRRQPKATSKRAAGALNRKRSGAAVSAKRSTAGKSAPKAKAPRGAAKRKGKKGAR